jgi:hypothetical protein
VVLLLSFRDSPVTRECEADAPRAFAFFFPRFSGRKSNVEFIEDALWELIESGASVTDSLGATSYSDFLADAGKRGALEKGVGALVLSGPEASLKSWFAEIARKLNKGEKLLTEDLSEVSKTSYFSRDEMSKLFGTHIAGECEQCLRTYNPAAEFVFVRLYLSTGQSGDGSLLWDVVQYEEPPPALVRIFFSEIFSISNLLLSDCQVCRSGRSVPGRRHQAAAGFAETGGVRRGTAGQRSGAKRKRNVAAATLRCVRQEARAKPGVRRLRSRHVLRARVSGGRLEGETQAGLRAAQAHSRTLFEMNS